MIRMATSSSSRKFLGSSSESKAVEGGAGIVLIRFRAKLILAPESTILFLDTCFSLSD